MADWFSLSLRLNRFPIKRAQRVLKEIQDIRGKEYNDYIQQKRHDIVNFHLANNPFYKNFFGKRNFKKWEDVPVMKKKDLQRPLEERLSRNFALRKVYVSKTSGSSGEPFIFAKDRFCHALTWAEFIDRYKWFGINLDKSVQARFYGIPLDRFGYFKERLKDRFSFRYRFPIFDLNERNMQKFLEDFRNKKFDYVNGYTSSIVLFAKFLRKKDIILKDICPNLKLCIVTSEMFFEQDRKLLESQFQVPVINEYGASELGLLAFENPSQEWILNTETMHIEVVDDNDKLLPPGQQGRIIVTSLFNKAHPFIRYDIGDRGVIEIKDNGKKHLLKELLGRTNDMAILPSGKIVPGLTFYYITKRIIEDDAQVKEFIVQQTNAREFKVIYVAESALSKLKLEEISQAMTKYLEEGLDINFEHVDILKRSDRGKLKQFESMI